jgi:Membrane protein involved in the export of O-antigen and teichoic acid
MENLTAKAKTGAFWVMLEQVVLRVFSFITNIVLARLLFPEDFGIVAIAFVAWEIIKLFGNFGIAAKLIYQQGDIAQYATSAFWLNIIVSAALAIATVAVSPFIALFYNNELIQPILMLFSLAFVIQSFGTTHLALLRKELAFKKNNGNRCGNYFNLKVNCYRDGLCRIRSLESGYSRCYSFSL